MNKLILSLAFALLSIFSFGQTTWNVDPMHSSVNFKVKHMGISFVQGRFDKFDGKVSNVVSNLDQGKFSFSVDVSSINTGVEMRDNHLKNADFFEVEKFPTMKFDGVAVKKNKKNEYVLTGELTIKDVTKKVSVPVKFGGITKNQQGKQVLGFQTIFNVNRLDYNISYDPSGAGVAKEIEVQLYFEMVK